MWLQKFIKLTTFLLMSAAFAVPPVMAVTSPDASPKHRLCQPCTMPLPPIVVPRQGMVLSYGSILSDTSLWYLVDLERGEATRILARDDRPSQRLVIVEQTTRPIPHDDLSILAQLDKRIWASKVSLPTRMTTDVVWNLWLRDGDDVRYDFAPGIPDGLAKECEQIMRRLIGEVAPARPQAHP